MGGFLLMSQLLYSTINAEIREQAPSSSGDRGPLPHGALQADIPVGYGTLVSYRSWTLTQIFLFHIIPPLSLTYTFSLYP